MTILTGESYTVESLKQFMNRLNVDYTEIAESLPEDEQQKILDAENEFREDAGRPTVDSLSEVDEEELRESIEANFGMTETMKYVLESRDQDYTIMFDGVSLHRIVEIDRDQE